MKTTKILYLGVFLTSITLNQSVFAIVNDDVCPKNVSKPKIQKNDKNKMSSVGCLYDGLASFSYAGKYGFINASGKVIIPPIYDSASHFKHGNAKVTMYKPYQYFTKSGNKFDSNNYYSMFQYKNGLIRVKTHNKKQGVLDASGKTIIPPVYNRIFNADDKDEVILVELDGKYGGYNRKGQLVIPLEYDDISAFKGKYALATKGELTYIIDNNNKVMTSFNKNDLTYSFYKREFRNGVTIVKQDEKLGVVNQFNQLVFPIEFDVIYPFRQSHTFAIKANKLYRLQINGRATLINSSFVFNGAMVRVNEFISFVLSNDGWIVINNKTGLPVGNDRLRLDKHFTGKFNNGLVRVVNKQKKYGFIDEKGNLVVPAIYDETDAWFNHGFVRVFINDKTGYDGKKVGLINTNGEVVIPIGMYDAIDDLLLESENSDKAVELAPVMRLVAEGKDKYKNSRLTMGYASTASEKQGELVIPLKFVSVKAFSSLGYAIVSTKEKGNQSSKYGVIDQKGKMIIPAIYDEILGERGAITSDLILAKKNGKLGVINLKNKQVLPFLYNGSHISINGDTVTLQTKQCNIKKYQVFDNYGKAITGFFDDVSVKKEDKLIIVKKDTKKSKDNENSGILLAEISDDEGDNLAIDTGCPKKSDDKSGVRYAVYDFQGSTIVPLDYYRSAPTIYKDLIQVQKTSDTFFIDISGKRVK